jgi:hypothetical protein
MKTPQADASSQVRPTVMPRCPSNNKQGDVIVSAMQSAAHEEDLGGKRKRKVKKRKRA